MLDRFVRTLTSLRLTVVLLCAGLLLVFVGTLAQVHEGLYQAQTRYFRSWFVWHPTIGDYQWPILLPGGYLLGTLLIVNLLAAHATRFKFTKKKIGIILVHAGVVCLLVGQLLTDQQANDTRMNQDDADLLFSEFESRGVGSQQINDQQCSQQVAAGQQNWPLVIADSRVPDEPAFKIARLR